MLGASLNFLNFLFRAWPVPSAPVGDSLVVFCLICIFSPAADAAGCRLLKEKRRLKFDCFDRLYYFYSLLKLFNIITAIALVY